MSGGPPAVLLLLAILLAAGVPVRGEETRRPLLLVHYMPWFEAQPFSQRWGWHWTMNVFDPGKLVGGNPELASHYHPLIGPYDSGDPAVLECQALQMRLAGIDGVIVDWYGREDLFDYATLHRNTSRFVQQATRAGLKFAICYEDQTIPRLVAAGRLAERDRARHARAEIGWLAENWFTNPAYLRLNGRPLLLSFGRDGLTDPEWEEALRDLPSHPVYLSEHERRGAAAGAFDWPVPQAGLPAQEAFQRAAGGWPFALPVAFPRFHDIYEEARVRKSYGRIADEHGQTFATTLERALRAGRPAVQISTWNDWGEGTAVEPSVEFGYRDLETVQRLRRQLVDPDSRGGAADLRLPRRLLQLRRSAPAAGAPVRELDEISRLLAAGATAEAKMALARVEARAPMP